MVMRSFHSEKNPSLLWRLQASSGTSGDVDSTPENKEKDGEEMTTTTTAPAAVLPPSSSTTSATLDNDNSEDEDILAVASSTPEASSSSMAMMISQENKRILIEELGYKRTDVAKLKYDLAPAIVEKRIRCPPGEGIPDEWCRSSEELALEANQSKMIAKLENESKYPFKLPLLGISLILFGKGFSDAIITLIKVNIDFPGASLAEEFFGIPVLLIDSICVLVGASLGWWTWNTMK